MNALIAVLIGAATVYLAYTRYARRSDRNVIQSDPKRATPATLYMDGVDFMPTNRNILFGYHFKSIAAATPVKDAQNLWAYEIDTKRRSRNPRKRSGRRSSGF